MSVTLQHELATVKAKCAICFKQIEKGEPIRLVRRFANGTKRWAHADCYHAAPGGDGDGDGEDNHPAPAADLTEDAKERIASLTSRVEQLEAKLEQSGGFKVLEIRQPDRDPVRIEGAVHPIFPEVLELASVREDIFLPGPAGCGKSHLAQQIADALGLRFGSISCSAGMSESQLLGRCVPAGEQGQFEFQGTQFLDCYENGGVFLFDEIDAADSNVLLVINSALANGHLSVPNRHDNAHVRIDHENILWRGAAAIAMAKILEQADFRVELWTIHCASKSYSDKSGHCNAVCLKRAGDPLDIATFSAAVSGWFYRTLMMRAKCIRNKAIAGGGKPRAPFRSETQLVTNDPNAIVISGVYDEYEAVYLARAVLKRLAGIEDPPPPPELEPEPEPIVSDEPTPEPVNVEPPKPKTKAEIRAEQAAQRKADREYKQWLKQRERENVEVR